MTFAKRVSTVMLGAVVAGGFAAMTPAHAVSEEELLQMFKQQQQEMEAMKREMRALKSATEQNAATAAKAQETAQATSDASFKWAPSPTIKSADGKFEAHVRGRLYVDYGHVSDKSTVDSQNSSKTEFRTARLGIEGIAWKDIKYKFEVDFADNEVDIKDAYVEYKGFKNVGLRAGHFKEGLSLEESTSSRHISLMERASFTDAFQYARRIGFQVNAKGEIWVAKVGIFGAGTDENSERRDEGSAFAARIAVFPEVGNGGRIHAGINFRYRDISNEIFDMAVRYRQRPHAHTSSFRYVDTGVLTGIKSDTVFGAELAGVFGPVWLESEWAWSKSKVADGYMDMYNGENNLKFHGGYIGAGWFITGESRAYKGGNFGRPKVNNPVFDGGAGAWAITGRWDFIDLVDSTGGVYGGEQSSIIFGVNWYLNRHTVIKLNYANSKVKEAFGRPLSSGLVDEEGKNTINSFTARVQVDW